MVKEDIKKCYLLYNPVSTGFSNKKIDKISEVLSDRKIDFTPIKSRYPGHIIDLIHDTDKEGALIITMGGDGTVGEAYNAYNSINQQGIYSHIPTGTTNDIAKNYDVASDNPSIIINDILEGDIVNMDSYSVNNKIAAYTSAFGYVAHVPYITNSKLKKTFGHAGYVISALPTLLKKPEKYNITYETDNKRGTDEFILGAVSNSIGFGGIELFRNADLTDGKIELILLKNINPKLIKELFGAYLKNDINLSDYEDYIVTDSSSHIKLKFNDKYPTFPIDIDGENSLVAPWRVEPTVDFKVEKPIKVLKRKKH